MRALLPPTGRSAGLPMGLLAGLSILGLSACAPSAPTGPEPEAPPAVTCDASFFETLRGEPIEVVNSISTPLRVRVLAADAFVPRDFDPNRLTFTENPDGEVSRVFCG